MKSRNRSNNSILHVDKVSKNEKGRNEGRKKKEKKKQIEMAESEGDQKEMNK